MKREHIILTMILGICFFNAPAQQQLILQSSYLPEPDTVLVFQPKQYNHQQKYPLVFLLHGFSENYNQWAQTVDLQKLADDFNFLIVTPDGFETFYLNSTVNKNLRYEEFFFKELVPRIHDLYRIDTKNIFISGLSMGGYGALRYFINHSDYFNTAGSTSGALDFDFSNFRRVSQLFWKSDWMTNALIKHIGNPNAANWKNYSIRTLIKEKNFKREFIFDCGVNDVLYANSSDLNRLVDKLNIPATFISQPGGHDTAYWAKSIDHHFIYFKQHLKKD